MAVKIDDVAFAQLCIDHDYHVPSVIKAIQALFPEYLARPDRVTRRIKRLRQTGLLPLDSGNYVSTGEVLKGSSTLYDKNGNVTAQWVKSDVEKEAALQTIQTCIEEYVQTLPTFKAKIFEASHTSDDLMAVYPLADAHLGMRAYKENAGDDWDLKKAQEVYCGIFDRLIRTTPHCTQAVIVNLGDYFHRDNMAGVTERHRHKLDTDGTYRMMVDTGFKVMLQMINSALEHHKTVRIINAVGNHDDTGAIFLQVALKHMYANEPRVKVDCSESAFGYFRHGNSLFGTHHGQSVKPDKLPLLMATDRAKEWGETKFRYFLTGHIHHDTRKEYSGCIVESFRTLTAKDTYTTANGYRSGQDSKALVIHKDFGEVERHTINIAQVLR